MGLIFQAVEEILPFHSQQVLLAVWKRLTTQMEVRGGFVDVPMADYYCPCCEAQFRWVRGSSLKVVEGPEESTFCEVYEAALASAFGN